MVPAALFRSGIEVREGEIVSDNLLTPLYLCTYKLKTIFDQCLFGLVEIVSSESGKTGRKFKSDFGLSDLLKILGIKLSIGYEGWSENNISSQKKTSITPILQLAILLRYFEKSKGIAIELNAKDNLFECEPNSLAHFVVKSPSIIFIKDKRPIILNTSQWEDVLGQLRFETKLEKEDHFAYVTEVLGRPIVATMSYNKITPFGSRELYNTTYPQVILARIMGDRGFKDFQGKGGPAFLVQRRGRCHSHPSP